MADEVKYDSTQPVRSQQSATYTPTGLSDPKNLETYNAKREGQINDVYGKALDSTKQSLKTAYDQNLSDLQAARDKIAPQYRESANALAAEYKRQKRNTAMQGAANGLNTGAGSQLALGQSMAYQKNAGSLARSENEALNEANRGIADLGVKYKNDIAQAVANNDYKLAASLLDEYEAQYNRQMTLENQNYERAQQAENQAYQRAFQEENRDYTRAYDIENRDYTRNWNTENRDYERAWNTENRDYTRDWNQNERDYNRAWNEENRAYDRYWSENDRGYDRMFNEENRDYTRAWNEDERAYSRNWNEDERNYDRTMTEAASRAEFGDFSGYASIYGQDIADAMRDIWIAQNPIVAYHTGAITAEEYQMLTGKYPYNSSGGSSGYSSGYGKSGSSYGSGYSTGTQPNGGGNESYSMGNLYAMEATGVSAQDILAYVQATSSNPQADVAKLQTIWQGQNNAVEDMWARNSLSDNSKLALNGVTGATGAEALAQAAAANYQQDGQKRTEAAKKTGNGGR